MSESMQNNAETHIGDNSDHGQGLVNQALCNVPPNLGRMPSIPLELASNIRKPNYYQTLVFELMKQIPPVLVKTILKTIKLVDRVARCNPKVYDRKYDLVELHEWIKGMENIFTIAKVPDEKKVSIGTFCLTGEADIWWNTMKDRLLGPEFTWNKFLEELGAKFYPTTVQR